MKRLPTLLAYGVIVLLGTVTGFCFWYSGSTATATPTLYAPPKPPTEKIVTLIAVGDIMLSRNVEQKMLAKKDWLYPFRETYQVTTAGDIIFGNLESPLVEGPIVETGQMVFRADPKAVEGLRYGGFNVLSLANNHFKNKGEAGIKRTVEVLDENNIAHAGAGMNDREARQPAILEKNGMKFGFLAYVDSSFTPASYEATASRNGSPFLNEQMLIEDIEKLKNNVDVVIVSMHAGTEYAPKPTEKQISFAHAAIDSGAKLVIGHHPHVVQPMEKYKNGYILYSLGNFVFDQMWSEETREGALATITFLNAEIKDAQLTPIKIYDYAQPRVLSDTEGKAIISRMVDFTF